MDIGVVSLFPELTETMVSYGVLGRAIKREQVSLNCVNPRDFAADTHRTVDDRPYGGGPGMVLKVEPVRAAIEKARAELPAGSPVIFLGPQGRRFDQKVAIELSQLPGMVLVAGRYEGFDERLLESVGGDEISLGDYVLSGGEVAAFAIIDSVVRLLPGVLGDDASAEQDSFMEGLLDHPHYTRPEEYEGMAVPQVLLNGNHAEIRRWRLKQSLGRTWQRRPDLLEQKELSEEENSLLQEFIAENAES
jgi:tRNA (guanine37-N1)-methyltransferase